MHILNKSASWYISFELSGLLAEYPISTLTIVFMHVTYISTKSFQVCGKGDQSHIFRGSKGVGVTIESYGKLEIFYINVDNF